MLKPVAVAVLACSLILVSSSARQQGKIDPTSAQSHLAGTWRGTSECAVVGSPCHDETNVYRFKAIPGKPASFHVTASKVVDDKEIVMGNSDWTYDLQRHTLQSELSNGTKLRFTVDGDKMEGTLTTPDQTVYRRIHLKKES